MRTLFIVARAPYPPRSGAPKRSWQNINILAGRGPVHVLSVGDKEPGDYAMPIVAEWVHLDESEFPAKRGLRSLLARVLSPRQYPLPDVLATTAINERLRGMLERVKPDIIVLSHWKNACPTPLEGLQNVILDMHNMHNIESRLPANVETVRPRFLRPLLLWRWRARERALIRNAKRTWVCGRNDAVELSKLDRRAPAPVVWPNVIDLTEYADVHTRNTDVTPSSQRNAGTIIFIGLYSYEATASRQPS